MECEEENQNLNDFIGKILGMAKYASHNKNGQFDINAAAKGIGAEPKLVDLTLRLLNEINAIKINSFENNIYQLEYLNPVSAEEIAETDIYEELNEEYERRIKFKEQILSADEKELLQMIS